MQLSKLLLALALVGAAFMGVLADDEPLETTLTLAEEEVKNFQVGNTTFTNNAKVENVVTGNTTNVEETELPEIVTLKNDLDVINEEANPCCPDGGICCGLEIGCIPITLAPEVECSVIGPDSPIPCCNRKLF